MNIRWFALMAVVVLSAAAVLVVNRGADPVPARPDSGRSTTPVAAEPASAPRAVPGASRAVAFVERVTRTGRHAFLFFHRGQAQLPGEPHTAFVATMQKVSDRAEGLPVDVTDPAEAEIVRRYDLERTPLPAVLVFAPNGVLVRGVVEIDEPHLLAAFATPAMASCMKALSLGRTVLLCVQGAATAAKEAALQGPRDLVADPAYAARADLVVVDPRAEGEAAWLAGLGAQKESDDALTLVITPAGSVAATLVGATTKEQIVEALKPKAPS